MKINSNNRLVLRDVYLYDIESCHYSIMKHLGLDVSEINEQDKKERNIHIGKMMQKNPRLTSLLRNTTRSIIDEYLTVNGINDSDILLRQYDGIITTRTLRKTQLQGIPLNIRKHFEIFISSIDRKRYIAIDTEREITTKGIPFNYEEMDKIYEKICRINYARKETIFRHLQAIKDYIMTTNNTKLFGIPARKDNKVNIFLKDYGQIEIAIPTLKIMDPDDIDREWYFKYYIEPFTKSIVVEFVR